MAESNEIKKTKIDLLFEGFINEGYNSNNKLDKSEFIKYLDNRTNKGKFDEVLSNKLFQVLNLDSKNTISTEDFISGYLQFEEDIKKNVEELNIKLEEKQKIYNELLEKYKNYKEEKLNSEGLCENSKVYGEITEIDIKRKLRGIKEIIIKVIYNEQSEEFHFEIGDNTNDDMEHKKFEFKPTSRNDHFEFIMQGINDKDQIFDIGNKVFPLDDINTQEEYLVQIIVPEINDEKQIAAYINAKIILYWNDYKKYEQQKKKAETKLKKLIIALNQANDYLKKVREIYGDLLKRKGDIDDLIDERINQRKNEEININKNEKELNEEGIKQKNYIVEFNNQKTAQLTIEFNNIKEIKNPSIIQQEENQEEINQEENMKEINQEEFNENNEEQINQENQEEINQEEMNEENTEIEAKEEENKIEIKNEENQNDYETKEEINMNEYLNNENLNNENDNNINYEENQIVNEENIIKEENREIIQESTVKNGINEEELIRQSLNKELMTQNILPVIVHEKVNDIIYDNNVKTLPIIYGETKISYLKEGESLGFDINNLIEKNEAQISESQYINQTNQKLYGTQVKKIQNYEQINPIQNYSQITQGENYIQQEYVNNPQGLGIGFEEYQSTNYQYKN